MRANEIRSLRTEEKDICTSTQMYKNVCFHVWIKQRSDMVVLGCLTSDPVTGS